MAVLETVRKAIADGDVDFLREGMRVLAPGGRRGPGRRAGRELVAVVSEAYVLGVSTRRVEDLVEALGIASLSKSEVSRMCTALDTEVAAFRHGPLAGRRHS